MTGLRVALEIVDVVGRRFWAGWGRVMLAPGRVGEQAHLAGGAEVVAARPVVADPPIGHAVDVDVLNRARLPEYREPVQGSDLPAAELRPEGDEVVLGISELLISARDDESVEYSMEHYPSGSLCRSGGLQRDQNLIGAAVRVLRHQALSCELAVTADRGADEANKLGRVRVVGA